MFSKGGLISEIADLNFVAVHAPCWRALARKANPFPAGLSEPGSAYLQVVFVTVLRVDGGLQRMA